MFFELVSTLCAIVPDYANEYMTKENKNWTRFKNFAPKLNLNHNIYISYNMRLILLTKVADSMMKVSSLVAWLFSGGTSTCMGSAGF